MRKHDIIKISGELYGVSQQEILNKERNLNEKLENLSMDIIKMKLKLLVMLRISIIKNNDDTHRELGTRRKAFMGNLPEIILSCNSCLDMD